MELSRATRLLLLTTSLLVMPRAAASGPSDPGPARVDGAVKEADLATITLSPEAQERLGIETSPAEEKTVSRVRLYGGEALTPPGESVVVTAPITGRLLASEDREPLVGTRVQEGETIFRLWPVLGSAAEVLSPADRLARTRANVDIEAATVDATGQAAKAQIAVDAARLKLDRAQELHDRNAGSVRALEDARAELDAAQATLTAAKRRLEFLTGTNLDPDVSTVPVLAVESPIDGMLQQVFVAVNQMVTVGTPLFSVANLERIWIRVPVYVGELEMIGDDKAAVSLPGAAPGDRNWTAKRVPAPATASVAASTVDLYFGLADPNGTLRPGQRVLVTLPLGGTAKRLTVPWSALVFDIHGSAWVYENVQPHVFSRRRVELERVESDTAILRRGLVVGCNVVSAGVAELYGTEFGVGK